MGQAAYGSSFTFDSLPFGEVTSISGPDVSIETIDVTHMESADQFRQFIRGLGDGGEISISFQYAKAFQASLYAKLGMSGTFAIAFADGGSWGGSGIFTGMSNTGDVAGKLEATATIKITGKPTFSAA